MPSSFSSKQLLTAAIDAVIVLAAAGHETFAWAHWPVYAAALAAQLTLSTLFACLRDRIHDGQKPPLRDVMGVPTAMEVILTLPALSIAAVAGNASFGDALTWAALLTIAAGILSERNARPIRATERHAEPGCASSRSATDDRRSLDRLRGVTDRLRGVIAQRRQRPIGYVFCWYSWMTRLLADLHVT